ncbi:PIN domain-containing protein [Halorussus pelagicus]|uniref:PIN domain-containing protein n=1 Tax=Halorussus pelagicus TaxID=2505977 RepID=UPI000FFB7213|nr:PIN domain-containing protein [Halorussus pelagicus]
MKLLDASVLVGYAQGEQAAAEYLERNDDTVFGAPTIVLSEVYTGLFRTTELSRKEVKAKYGWVRAVPFTDEAAVETADIRATLSSRGEKINASDTYIAGTARAFDVPLVTADRDFKKVDGLELERYREQ